MNIECIVQYNVNTHAPTPSDGEIALLGVASSFLIFSFLVGL